MQNTIAIADVESVLSQSKTELSSAMLKSGVPDARDKSTAIKIAFDIALQRMREKHTETHPLAVKT